MTVNTAAGTRLYIGTTAADSSTDSYVLIGQVTNIPEFGKRYKEVDFIPLKDRGKQKSKGSYDDMTMTIELARDITDAGQTMALISRDSDINYNFKISLADSDIRFKAQVASFTNILGTADNVIMRKMDLLVQSGTVAVTASGSDTLFSTMVPGAVGVWLMDRYLATPAPVVPNLVATSAPPGANLFQAPRRLFGNNSMWNKVSAPVVDSAVVAPDNTWSASTLAGSGNWLLYPVAGDTVPAGTYTLAVNAKRNTGSDQFFSFSPDALTTRSPAKEATSSWQRFSYTFTLNAPSTIANFALCSMDGSTGANIQICDFELYKGSKDLGPQVLGGHIYLGASGFDTTPIASGGVVDLSTGGWGIAQFRNPIALGKFTATALFSRVAVGSGFHGFLSDPYDYTAFTAIIEVGDIPETSTSKKFIAGTANGSGLWNLLNVGYHVITITYDGVTEKLYLDDILLFQAAENTTSPTLADFFVGIVNLPSIGCGEKFAAMLLYPNALSATQVRNNVTALQNRFPNQVVPPARIYCAVGDSITGSSTYTFPYQFGPNANPTVLGNNFGIGGSSLNDLIANAAVVDSVIPASPAGRKFILSVLIGANDLGWTGGGSVYAAAIAAYCDARRAAGWKVVLCTILPRSDGAGSPDTAFNTFRNAANAVINGWAPGLHYDGLADFAADATMGPNNAAANLTYYDGVVHPTAAGHAILETIIRPVINGL